MHKNGNNLQSIEVVSNNKKGRSKNQKVYKGTPAVQGLALGDAIVIQEHNYVISHEEIAPENVPSEIERYKNAITELQNRYEKSIQALESYSKKDIGILEAYILIITDPIITQSIIDRIKNLTNVELAVAQEFDYQKSLFKNSSDPILKERANELSIIKENLLATLKNSCRIIPAYKNAIVVAHSLDPSDIYNLKVEGIQGIITEVGGITSHASILARSHNIPAVIGVREITKFTKDFDFVLLDGFEGTVTINPKKDTLTKFQLKKTQEEIRKKRLGALIKLPTRTKDGKLIKLYANVTEPKDVDKAIEYGAEGIGLVRTEMVLIKEKSIPDVRELTKLYKEYTEKAYPNIVTFRVYDIGSDKYPFIINTKENNPALGLRGIRYLLSNKSLFKTQIKAILKASANKNAQLLLPMISSIRELKESLKIIEECKNFLKKENRPFNPFIPIGIMIETPASALIADELAKYCDFFSIGTNDLTQYTLAADRASELVADYFDQHHFAVLRLIKMTVDAAKRKGIPITVCGDMAGDPAATSFLIGVGVDALSVDHNVILELKSRIRDSHYLESVKYAESILANKI